MTNQRSPEICCYQSPVRQDQARATEPLGSDAAAAIVTDAVHNFFALQRDPQAPHTPERSLPSIRTLTLQRAGADGPCAGEIARCFVHRQAQAQDTLSARVTGPRGIGWNATVQLDEPWPDSGGATPLADDGSLPPSRVLRSMRSGDCDQAGHVNVQVFMALADDATRAIFAGAAGSAPGPDITRARISFKKEVFEGDVVSVHGGLRGCSDDGTDAVFGIVHRPSGALACIVETHMATSHGAEVAAPADEAIGDWPALPAARPPAMPRPDAAPPAAAVTTVLSVVDAWDADASGRLSLRALVNLCSIGARQYLANLGLTGARFLREKMSVAAVDYLVDVPRRPALGANLTVKTHLLSASAKSIRFCHHLTDSDDGTAYATVEIVGVMLDLQAHRSMEIPEDVKQRLALS